jgi:hypothetical protein
MKKVLRRYFVILMVAAVLLTLTSTYLSVYARKEAGQFTLRDMAGDRSVLSGVSLGGTLADSVHFTDFTIANGAVQANTTLKAYPQENNPIYPYLGKVKLGDERIYEVNFATFSLNELFITDGGRSGYGQERTAKLQPRLYFRQSGEKDSPESSVMERPTPLSNADQGFSPANGEASPANFTSTVTYELANQLPYGLTEANGNIYYIVPTTRKWEGVNSLYKLAFRNNDSKNASNEIPESIALASFDLDAIKAADSAGMDILGLESVGGKLAVIIAESGQLKVYCFDSESGQSLGEVVVAKSFALPGLEMEAGNSESISGKRYDERYQAYPDKKNNQLNLLFNSYNNDAASSHATVWTLDLSAAPKVINQSEVTFAAEDGKDNQGNMATAVAFREGKLYLLKVLEQSQLRDEEIYLPARPERIFVHVYEQSKLVYKGEVLTDATDDLFHVYNRPPMSSYSYRYGEHRHFERLQIK